MARPASSESNNRSARQSTDTSGTKGRRSTTIPRIIELKDNTEEDPPSCNQTDTDGGSNYYSAIDGRPSGDFSKGQSSKGERVSRGESIRIALGSGKYSKWSQKEYEEEMKKRAKRLLKSGFQAKKLDENAEKEEEIDVLYENQRGSFIFGIPLFSAKSLLNFDPSAWTNKHQKDSPVNVSNAQLPDPSWQWAWKTWYIDMSGDVDDGGWQYSFSFNPIFNWHGNHMFFNSFVRRRRWLRKRVRYNAPALNKRSSVAENASSHVTSVRGPHSLNPDYFSIHSERRKIDSSALREAVGAGTLGGAGWGEDQTDLDEDEIKNVPQLMKALRAARLDREKVAAVERFAKEGGEEVHYLAERIPAIMNLLVFQSSRRAMLNALRSAYKAATSGELPNSSTPTSAIRPPTDRLPDIPEHASAKSSSPPPQATPGVLPYLEALRVAISSAEDVVGRLEFWSDSKDINFPSEKLSSEEGYISAEENGYIHASLSANGFLKHPGDPLRNDSSDGSDKENVGPKKWKGKERAVD